MASNVDNLSDPSITELSTVKASKTVEKNHIGYEKQFERYLGFTLSALSAMCNHTAMYLKCFTKSKYVFIYLVEGGRLFLSTDKGRDHYWTIEANSPRIAAAVAFQKELVVIQDTRKKGNFADGCHTEEGRDIPKAVLCVPIATPNDECFAVLEFQKTDHIFESNDIKVVVAITGWMGAAVHQNRENAAYDAESKFSINLFKFLEKCIKKGITDDDLANEASSFAKQLVGAEKVVYYKIHYKNGEPVAYVFEEALAISKCTIVRQMFKKNISLKFSDDQTIIFKALYSKEVINIKDIYDSRFDKDKDSIYPGVNIRSMLILPVWGKEHVIAIMVLINKSASLCFSDKDADQLNRFGNYMAVALAHLSQETLSNDLRLEVTDKQDYLQRLVQPCSHQEKEQYKINRAEAEAIDISKFEWYISPALTKYVYNLVYRMMKEATRDDSLKLENTFQFITAVRTCYRNNPYHNFEHAFNVGHSIYSMIIRNMDLFSDVERKALMVSAFCHDIDHPGVNNNFLALIDDSLAILYENSTLENYHFFITMSILADRNLFSGLYQDAYTEFVGEIQDAILSTDLVRYFKTRNKLVQICHDKVFDWHNDKHRYFLKSAMMTTADLSGMLKDFDTVRYLTNNLYREFYQQGDRERTLGYFPVSMMDRGKRYLVPQDQVHFMNVVVIPAVELVVTLLTNVTELYDKALEVRDGWQDILAKGRDYWIEIDTYNEEGDHTLIIK